MIAASDSYVNGIRKRFAYSATWLPNTKIALGDIGIFDGDYFRKQTSLKEMGIRFKSRKSDSVVDFKHSSTSGFSISTRSSGNVSVGGTVPVGHATVEIDFSEAGAFLFHASGCSVDEIDNVGTIGHEVMPLVKSGEWQSSYILVVAVVSATCATILISNSQKSKVELSVDTADAISDLANLSAGVKVQKQSGDVTQFVAISGISPLFRGARVKRAFLDRLLGRPKKILFRGPLSNLDESIGHDIFELI